MSYTGWARKLKLYYVEPIHMEYSLVDCAGFFNGNGRKEQQRSSKHLENEK